MSIFKATREYEVWLADNLDLISRDLALKHQRMRQSFFGFFRATFYRWAQWWPKRCQDLASGPKVFSIGDLHVENFGTWRDIEGRLVWGINDFDEMFRMSYTNDLVRLVASADISLEGNFKNAASAILKGYIEGMEAGGRPFVLAEEQTPLREMVRFRLRDPAKFWEKLKRPPTARRVPKDAITILKEALPREDLSIRIVPRISGLGSLGRQRFVALADWRGGTIAREVKGRAPSACIWAYGKAATSDICVESIWIRAARCPDPFFVMTDKWVVRRLSPDCCRIELAALPDQRNENYLLWAMGFETANVHLATKNAAGTILKDLKSRPKNWLHEAARTMLKTLASDWTDWKTKN